MPDQIPSEATKDDDADGAPQRESELPRPVHIIDVPVASAAIAGEEK